MGLSRDFSGGWEHRRTEEGRYIPCISTFMLSSWQWLAPSLSIALLIVPPLCTHPSLDPLALFPPPVASDWVITPPFGPLNPVYTSESSPFDTSFPLNHRSGIVFASVDLDWYFSNSSFQQKLVLLRLGKISDPWSRIYFKSANICYCPGNGDIK